MLMVLCNRCGLRPEQCKCGPSIASDCSKAYRDLSDAVDKFLRTSGCYDFEEQITRAVLVMPDREWDIGTSTVRELVQAQRTHGHPSTPIYRPIPKRNRRVEFMLDERSYCTLEEIKRRTGCEFAAVKLLDAETGKEREILIPVGP